ncbi:hypothetical protein EJB05_24655 [Eragrostis curvula]|uniref:Protein FLX-like 2 n=1 Tax=Eragrostis curvula TaxID=38414 RepID=A0A5J9V9H4_9POAL|nr:hypothetical protein EJB05_24655 [Eragrostis curvula]
MPRVKPTSGMPPYHHRPGPSPGQGPIPAHEMMHREIRDPYGQGMHLPPPGHGPGPFPYDMLPPLPPPEVLEQKLVAQHGEMQKLAMENERLAASHASLRKELAAAQQELQRLQAHGDAAKAAEEQEMGKLLERIAKMEADLKACDSLKAELQQAHAEAQSLAALRQNMAADVQKLSKDLQRNLGEAQQLPVLMADRDAARQEYQHLRATYEYERKLRVDHSESLQAMKRNYDSMVTELEKLRAELRNTASFDKSGVMYNANAAQKDVGTSGHHSSVGQIAYDGRYGGAQFVALAVAAPSQGGHPMSCNLAAATVEPSAYSQSISLRPSPQSNSSSCVFFFVARTTPTGIADALSGSQVGTAPRSGFDSSRSNPYDTSRIAAISSSKAEAHDVSRAGTGYDSLKGAGYDASRAPATGGQTAATAAHGSSVGYYGSNQTTTPPYAWGQSASTYGSVQVPPSGSVQSSYGTTAARPYSSAQTLPSYGHTQAPSAYGHLQLPSSYGLAQAPSPFAAAQGSSPYGLAAQPPAHGIGRAAANAGNNYEAPHGRK